MSLSCEETFDGALSWVQALKPRASVRAAIDLRTSLRFMVQSFTLKLRPLSTYVLRQEPLRPAAGSASVCTDLKQGPCQESHGALIEHVIGSRRPR